MQQFKWFAIAQISYSYLGEGDGNGLADASGAGLGDGLSNTSGDGLGDRLGGRLYTATHVTESPGANVTLPGFGSADTILVASPSSTL